MRKSGLLLISRKVIVLLFPVLFIIGFYFITDPFMMVYKYKDYSNTKTYLNQSHAGWSIFLNNKDSISYNSFMLGNSCTMAFPTREWKKRLDKNSIPIRLNGDAESLCALKNKLKRLDEYNIDIDNVLIVIGPKTFSRITPYMMYCRILHPDISGMSPLKYHMSCIKTSFFYPMILIKYIDYSIFKTYRKYMKGIIFAQKDYRDNVTNDIVNPRELEIKKDSVSYWKNHKNEFPVKRKETICHSVIYGMQKEMLSEIKSIFDKHHTNYKIMIDPDYRLRKINPQDIVELNNIFGEDNVFDFSGKQWFSNEIKYFYERGHYRPILGNKLLDIMYDENIQ